MLMRWPDHGKTHDQFEETLGNPRLSHIEEISLLQFHAMMKNMGFKES